MSERLLADMEFLCDGGEWPDELEVELPTGETTTFRRVDDA